MLVHPDADVLRTDLDELRQRVLKPPSDGHGSDQGRLHAGIFGQALGGAARISQANEESGNSHHNSEGGSISTADLLVLTG